MFQGSQIFYVLIHKYKRNIKLCQEAGLLNPSIYAYNMSMHMHMHFLKLNNFVIFYLKNAENSLKPQSAHP